MNINYTDMKEYENNKKTLTSDELFQNYYFRLEKSVTPLISYQLSLRTTLSNSHAKGPDGDTVSIYQRALEPAIDIFLRNPVYGLQTGYRRLEQWSTANLSDGSRETSDFYYTRLDITPHELPSFSFQFDGQKEYDHISPHSIDSTQTRYAGSSWYDLVYRGIKLSYNLTYARDENKTPSDEIISKTIDNSFNGLYSIGYSKSFLRNTINLSAVYQGNYVQNKNEQFANQTGAVPFKRTPSLGMYGLGSQLEPRVDILTAAVTLSDGVYNVPANTSSGTINLGQNGNKYNNIGIQLFSSEKPVDTLYIYVKKNITADTNLSTPAAWKVYKSNFNSPGNWTEVSILAVTISFYNQLDGIYRYEIKFSSEQNNLFFKAINMDTVSLNDVLVTEIEAHGTDVIPRSGKLSDTATFFTQGINLNAQIRPINRVTVALNYFLNRADEHPESVIDSVAGAFSNIFSKSKGDKGERLISDVTRTYGAGTTWVAHKYLTTTARFQRNEAFDNKGETDFKSNTYSLDFGSSPLPTLDTKLSLIRTYSYNFDQKQSTSDLYLLTVGSRLYRDVNMITDIGYTLSKTYATDAEPSLSATNTNTKATTKYVRGVIDARLTSRLFGNISYGLSRTSGTTSARTNDGTLIITYRPGQFINLSGSLKIFDTNGDTTTTEGFIIDWLFLQTVRMNFNYEHAKVQHDSKTIDSISSYVIWYITKFIDVQFIYGYNRVMNSEKTETYNIGGNLTCRFW